MNKWMERAKSALSNGKEEAGNEIDTKHKQYNLVVAASKGYEPGLSAFLHSFKHHHQGKDIKIYVLNYDLTEPFLEEHITPDIELIPITHKLGNIFASKIERFRIATEIGGTVMLCDADMFFCGSMYNYFKIAETGLIVGGANGSLYRFGEHWNEKTHLEVPEIFDYKTITSVPTLLDVERHGEVWLTLYNHKNKYPKSGGDFDLQNLFMCKMGRLDDIVTIPSQQVTGVHHFMVKPDTRAIKKMDKLVTGDGLELLIVHGKWWSGDWCMNLVRNMVKYCARLGAPNEDSRCFKGALDSAKLLHEEFDRWCTVEYESSVKPDTITRFEDEKKLYFAPVETAK